MTQCWPWEARMDCENILQSSLYTQGRLWNNQTAMDVSHNSIASHYLCWEGAQNLIFCMKCESSLWQKWYGDDHNKLLDAMRSSFHCPYTSKKGYQTLKQQWMSLCIARHPTFCAERVPKISYFAWNLGVLFGRNDMVRTLASSYVLWEAHSISHIPLRRVIKYPNSNECLSL